MSMYTTSAKRCHLCVPLLCQRLVYIYSVLELYCFDKIVIAPFVELENNK